MGDGSSLIITEQGEIPVSWQKGQIENVSIGQQRYKINLENGMTEIRDFSGNVIVSQEYGSVILYPNAVCRKVTVLRFMILMDRKFCPGKTKRAIFRQ